jgi:hypothetical protein
MKNPDNTELAGRIEAIGRALLRLTAELEMQRVIDGPRVSERWRQAVPDHKAAQSPVLHVAQDYLKRMADLLDDARQARQSTPHPD